MINTLTLTGKLNLVTVFLRTVGCLLLLFGACKLLALCFAPVRFLNSMDSLVPLSRGTLQAITGSLELWIGFQALRAKPENQLLNLVSIAWLSSCFSAYRLIKLVFAIAEPCHCIFGGAPALRAFQAIEEKLAIVVLALMLVGSYGLLVRTALTHSGAKKNAAA